MILNAIKKEDRDLYNIFTKKFGIIYGIANSNFTIYIIKYKHDGESKLSPKTILLIKYLNIIFDIWPYIVILFVIIMISRIFLHII